MHAIKNLHFATLINNTSLTINNQQPMCVMTSLHLLTWQGSLFQFK